MRVSICLKISKLAHVDRLDRRPDPVVPDLMHGKAMVLGNQPADRHTALTPHAGPHATAGKRLALVWTDTAQCGYPPDLPGSHFLTATDYGLVIRRQLKFLRRWIKLIKTAPQRAVLPSQQWVGCVSDNTRLLTFKACSHLAGHRFAMQNRRIGPNDTGRIAHD